MCATTSCPRCSKTTWRGCGDHVEQVMAGVPDDQRCTCETEPKRGLFARLSGR